MKTLGTVALVVAGLLSGACSNNGGNPAETAQARAYTTGIDGSRTLSTLTDAQKTDICANGISYYSMSVTRADACLLQSVGNTAAPNYVDTVDDSSVQAMCSRELNDCLRTTPFSRSYYTTLCVPKLSCPGSVAEYEACVNDLSKALVHGMDDFPDCDALTTDNYKSIKDPSTNLANTDKPASCRTLDSKCSGLTQAIMTMLWPGGR